MPLYQSRGYQALSTRLHASQRSAVRQCRTFADATKSQHENVPVTPRQTLQQAQSAPPVAGQANDNPLLRAALQQRPQGQFQPGPSPKPRQPLSPFFVPTVIAALLAIPPITYMYYQHRKEHMRLKKEAMLADIRSRHGFPST